MDSEVKTAHPCSLPKFVVGLFILVTTLTFCSVERFPFLRRKVFSQESPRFKFFKSPTRTGTSIGPKGTKSQPVGKSGFQEKPLVLPYYHNHLPNPYIHPSNHSVYKNSVLVFVHNPKSGGSTVKVCMTRLLHQKPVLIFSKTRDKIREDLLNGDAALEPYYMGDSTLGICDYGPQPRKCSYFTMLREPYERAVSLYYFCQDGGNGCSQSNNSLEEFVLRVCSTFFHQLTVSFGCRESKDRDCWKSQVCQTSWHCNSTSARSNIPQDQMDTLLQYVIDHLDSIFAVIGLLNEYDLSLELFEDTFGLKFADTCRTLHHNKGSYLYREKASSNDEKLARNILIETAVKRLRENETIRKCMRADETIYQRAKEIFEIQKKELLKRKSYKS